MQFKIIKFFDLKLFCLICHIFRITEPWPVFVVNVEKKNFISKKKNLLLKKIRCLKKYFSLLFQFKELILISKDKLNLLILVRKI
ncbi:hypothetical protein BpHYR1_012340 [Brachionus plicatilis]|uniref:Uncharacterized protein n=1 Tax=Brachionus plicatilis TaxID=10195 RepID=A0A3M7PUL6_BRAPC|nr:hypothetical protein BpHYR1_012340 [Brachionus plicatilis]